MNNPKFSVGDKVIIVPTHYYEPLRLATGTVALPPQGAYGYKDYYRVEENDPLFVYWIELSPEVQTDSGMIDGTEVSESELEMLAE